MATLTVALIVWLCLPVLRTTILVETPAGSHIVPVAGLPVQPVGFTATDGVRLSGWLVPGSGPAVVLVPGFRADRMSMLPYARFLHAAAYRVLLYDSRGTGASGGTFSFGAGEVDDVLGAVRFMRARGARKIGLLGVSLGAGDAIVAAARDHRVAAAVADSAYADQDAEMAGLDHLRSIPLAPLAPLTVRLLTGADISAFRPIDAVRHVAPGALLLIHARYDTNPTTPLSGVMELYRAARPPVYLWLAPRGTHAGTLAAQPRAYARRVLRFLGRYLRPRHA